MAEVGIDITHEFPKPWTDEIVQAADEVVTISASAYLTKKRSTPSAPS